MTIYRVKFRTGPTAAEGYAELARAAGLRSYTGTEHVYALVEAGQPDSAVWNLCAALLQVRPDLMTEWIRRGAENLGPFDPDGNPNDRALDSLFVR